MRKPAISSRTLRLQGASAAAALAALIVLGNASAYVLLGSKWTRPHVSYFINPQNAYVPDSDAAAAIQSAAATWNAQTTSNVQLDYAGQTSSTTVAMDGANNVFFRNAVSPDGGSVIGTTYSWWDSTGAMVEGDIVFYTGPVPIFTGTTGCSNGVYVEDVATHELGHFLGLGHSSDPSATMTPAITLCAQTARNLAADDIAAIHNVYPPSASSPTAGGRPDTSMTSPMPGTGSAPSQQGTLLLHASEDAYQGDAQFTVDVDGKRIGSVFTATVSRDSGTSQAFTLGTDFASGQHTVVVTFINDAYGGTPSTDRNLYIDGIDVQGTAIANTQAALYSNGSATFLVGQ